MGTIGQLQIATGRFRLHPRRGPLRREPAAGPPVWCDRVPKGQKGAVQFQKIKQKGRPPPRGLTVAVALRRARLLGVARPSLPIPSPLCAPHRQIWDTRYDQARCHWKRTHGARGLVLRPRIGSSRDSVDRRRGGQFQETKKRKGAAGFRFQQAPGRLLQPGVTPFCSQGNELIRGNGQPQP